MKNQLKYGKLKFISFIILDLVCLIISNLIAEWTYLNYGSLPHRTSSYVECIKYMVIIDFIVTAAFGTLNEVIRRRNYKELVVSLKHVGISLVCLTLFLFSTKQGASFSRIIIYLAYGIYWVMMVIFRIALKRIFNVTRPHTNTTAMLVTTTGYVADGLDVVKGSGIVVKGLFITDKTNDGHIRDIPVIADREAMVSFLCWCWVDKVYVCGPENMDVPEILADSCRQMGISIYNTPMRKNLNYEVVKIRTVYQGNEKNSGLSFFEGEHDVPFKVNRIYLIYSDEKNNQNGFHMHKQSWQMMFCPYGEVIVLIDTGKEKKSIALNDPSTGLILHPSVWREITWSDDMSVLCVAASGHYEPEKLNVNYDDYQKFLQAKEWSLVLESAEFLGEER